MEDYGYDVAIDYRGKDIDALRAELAQATPDGIDIVFENVGGDIFEAVEYFFFSPDTHIVPDRCVRARVRARKRVRQRVR